jgi:hypothetical protein
VVLSAAFANAANRLAVTKPVATQVEKQEIPRTALRSGEVLATL